MELWKKNKRALELYNHSLSEGLPWDQELSAVEVVDNVEHATVFANAHDGERILLHSLVNPVHEVRLRLKGHIDKGTLLFFVVGFGMGYLVEELLAHSEAKVKVLVIEPRKDILTAALRTRDLEHVLSDARLRIIANDDSFGYNLNEFNRFNLNKANKIDYIHSGGYRRLLADKGTSIRKTVFDYLKFTFKGIGDSSEDTLIGIQNILRNKEVIINTPQVKLFKPEDKATAIIVSAGPSLDKNFQLLRDLQGKALIITGMTPLQKLKDAGITPDLVVNVERGKEHYNVFYKHIELPKESIFVGASVTDSTVTGYLTNRKIMSIRNTSPVETWVKEIIPDVLAVEAGQSVAHMSFSIAKELGCTNVILIGQDLAYGHDGEDHTSGTMYDKGSKIYNEERTSFFKKRHEESRIPVPGNEQETVFTNALWYNWIRWFSMQAGVSGMKVVNATEGGAFIPGTEYLPLSEALTKYAVSPLNFAKEHVITADPEVIEMRRKLFDKDIEGQYNMLHSLKDGLYKHIQYLEDQLQVDLTDARAKEIQAIIYGVRNTIQLEYLRFWFIVQTPSTFEYLKESDFSPIDTTEKMHQWIEFNIKHLQDLLGVVDIYLKLLDDETASTNEAVEE